MIQAQKVMEDLIQAPVWKNTGHSMLQAARHKGHTLHGLHVGGCPDSANPSRQQADAAVSEEGRKDWAGETANGHRILFWRCSKRSGTGGDGCTTLPVY